MAEIMRNASVGEEATATRRGFKQSACGGASAFTASLDIPARSDRVIKSSGCGSSS
jgi:hypothetical protein